MDCHQLVRNLPSLSSLPAVLNEIEKSLGRMDMSMEDLAEIISKDPDLTARILRMANSAFYGIQAGVETVSQALSLIGLDELRELLNGSSIVEYFQNIPASLLNMKEFWKHSVACGIAAKELAICKKAPEPERFFVAGLIHGIGRLVLLTKEPSIYGQILEEHQRSRQTLFSFEKEQLGFNHAEVGRLLLSSWQFPASLVNAVGHQHYPRKTASAYLEASIVHVADFLVNAMDIGNSGEASYVWVNPIIIEDLSLNIHQLQSIMVQVDRQFDEVIKWFLD